MNNTMTYEQIEKSVMESKPMKFLADLHSQMITTRGYPQWEGETVQDVLKQSFIKYLQSEVERLEKIKLFTPTCGYESEEEKGFQKGIQAQEKLFISDQITHLQAQVKELEA